MSDPNSGAVVTNADSLMKACMKYDAKVLICSERIANLLSLEVSCNIPEVVWITPEYHEQHHCFILTKEIAENMGGEKALIVLDPKDEVFSNFEKLNAWAGYLSAEIQGSVTFQG